MTKTPDVPSKPQNGSLELDPVLAHLTPEQIAQGTDRLLRALKNLPEDKFTDFSGEPAGVNLHTSPILLRNSASEPITWDSNSKLNP